MNDILIAILKDTFTLYQLKTRVRILKSYLLGTFFAGGQREQLTAYDLNWLKSLPQSFYQNFTKDNVYDKFKGLEQEIGKLGVLTIYLTFEPDDNILRQIGTFTRKSYGPILLDIKLDLNLIAGAALVWKGVYKDYSLRAKLEGKEGEILENFKKFLR